MHTCAELPSVVVYDVKEKLSVTPAREVIRVYKMYTIY